MRAAVLLFFVLSVAAHRHHPHHPAPKVLSTSVHSTSFPASPTPAASPSARCSKKASPSAHFNARPTNAVSAFGTSFPQSSSASFLPGSSTTPPSPPSAQFHARPISTSASSRRCKSASQRSSATHQSFPSAEFHARPTSTSTSSRRCKSASALPAASAGPTTSPSVDFLRGVNIGGWLVLDIDLNANLLASANAVNQWTFDSSAHGQSALDAHYQSYFNASSVQLLESYGVNALKIPVGYWSYNNAGTPYLSGADAYLEQAVGWAAAAGMKVWIDLSETDVSGSTMAEISTDSAMNHSLSILQSVAQKYGSSVYAETVVAIQIFSQPVALPTSTDCSMRASFVERASSTIKRAAANPQLQIVVPQQDSCTSSYASLTVAQALQPLDPQTTQDENIVAVCSHAKNTLAPAFANESIQKSYVGAFRANTVATMHVEGWTADVVAQVRQYVEAQLESFEAYTHGYFFWSWTNDDEESSMKYWGIKDGVDLGYVPVPLNDPSKRKHKNQCHL